MKKIFFQIILHKAFGTSVVGDAAKVKNLSNVWNFSIAIFEYCGYFSIADIESHQCMFYSFHSLIYPPFFPLQNIP